jgi:hypothetical protein
MENRIKETQLYLFGTRASAQTIRANQIRLYFSAVAYTLVQAIRLQWRWFQRPDGGGWLLRA